jgi:hypothetical protein
MRDRHRICHMSLLSSVLNDPRGASLLHVEAFRKQHTVFESFMTEPSARIRSRPRDLAAFKPRKAWRLNEERAAAVEELARARKREEEEAATDPMDVGSD